MKWIKKAGFTLLFTFSLSFSVSSDAAEQSNYISRLLGTDKLASVKQALQEVGLGDETIQKLIDLIERLRKSGLAITADFNTGLDEAIQGSKELKALNTIQEKIALLVKNIQAFKQNPKTTVIPINQEKEHKRSAAQAEAAALSLDSEPAQVEIDKKFIASTVQPVINEIDKALNELKNNIQQRIAVCKKEAAARGAEQSKELSHEASTLSSLTDREVALNKIIGRLTIIKQLLSPETLVSPAVSITDALIKELNTLHKEILENIKPFKGGLAGVLDGTIKDLTEGLSNAGKTISTNIGEDLQRNLRAVLGSSEMITIIENINKWLNDYDPKNHANIRKYANKEFISSITTQIEQLEYLFNNMNQGNPEKADLRLGEIIGQFKKALARYQEAIKQIHGEPVAAPRALYQSICQTNTELLDHVQGTLANIMNVLKKALFGTVDRLTSNLDLDNKIEKFHTGLRETVNNDLPRTLKKGVGYLTLGTIAACALCHIIWHDRPWQGHLKNIGIATGSLIGMFLVDPVINYFSKSKPQRG